MQYVWRPAFFIIIFTLTLLNINCTQPYFKTTHKQNKENINIDITSREFNIKSIQPSYRAVISISISKNKSDSTQKISILFASYSNETDIPIDYKSDMPVASLFYKNKSATQKSFDFINNERQATISGVKMVSQNFNANINSDIIKELAESSQIILKINLPNHTAESINLDLALFKHSLKELQ